MIRFQWISGAALVELDFSRLQQEHEVVRAGILKKEISQMFGWSRFLLKFVQPVAGDGAAEIEDDDPVTGPADITLVHRALAEDLEEATAEFHEACRRGHEAEVEGMLQGRQNPDARDNSGKTALHVAASNGRSGVMGLLLEARADVTLKDEEDNTALHLAALHIHPGCCSLLLEAGADADAVQNRGMTSLHLAADSGNVEVFQLLLPRSNVEARDAEGSTPLHYVSADGQQALVRLLLDAGADKNATQSDGKTPLQLATENGQELVVSLLAAGASSAPVAPKRQRQSWKKMRSLLFVAGWEKWGGWEEVFKERTPLESLENLWEFEDPSWIVWRFLRMASMGDYLGLRSTTACSGSICSLCELLVNFSFS